MFNEGRIRKDRVTLTVLLLLVLIPLEITASIVARETIGDVVAYFLLLVCISFNILLVVVSLLVSRLFWPSIIAIVLFGLLIIWSQLSLAVRMHYVTAEAQNIVHWAYSERLKTGSFPEDLSGYVFLHPEYMKHIQRYSLLDKDRFAVDYYVATPSTSHDYDSEAGWGYYPD